ncbi:Fe-S cluster assembly protein SufB [Acetobacter cibinongensis]|uniref:Cysteine desulfurase n=1 Tax=Acetobacter cibinongensis TaxID=146475 RepID=A0A1Z5YSV3_9PROT|nr:Fe-S cluster assembly protein SufB [Acetobacter cibinongensis]OUJ01269.1 cysteine desulfurase [Acetobacter cibinongensis]GAN60761.1 cysteine desulfurase activator complex subunit SufB [Acetobacter cibinongensis]GBQ12091.1 cysteine desulfurase [Acetobacter cibinongensis NRIC 0482]GEL58792.1 Fe-S cluster assembly protein SufB [Acetobacter cibinongensis]
MPAVTETREAVEKLGQSSYKWGFETEIDMDLAPKGLNEDTIRLISARKEEPEWLLEWRLSAYRAWLTMAEPKWAKVSYPPIDYQDLHYYAAPKKKPGPKSLEEVDPELLRTYEKLGIPLHEQALLAGVELPEGEVARTPVAVDAVFDSVSVVTTFRKTLEEAGVIFCPISEAVKDHPELVRKYLGTVVPAGDNFYAALNSAVFTDGSFVYVPKGVRCPMELSTYFRINARNTGQFERTLIVVEDGAYVSYLEGCTAPMRDENQLHAAVVELVAMEDASIKYSTVQNWYPGDENGRGGIYNFVTKRGACRGARSKISWTQVETGSAITWKYPSCILQGEGSVGEFYSVAVTNNHQQADTGTKMIHIGRNTRSTIIAKTISAGQSDSTYRGLVRVLPKASGARNFTQCDSLLIGDQCGAHTVPYIENRNMAARIEHEATTSKISEDQLFYCRQRGLSEEDAVGLIVNGFCRDVLKELPMEFAVEAQKLLQISLEGSVG